MGGTGKQRVLEEKKDVYLYVVKEKKYEQREKVTERKRERGEEGKM